MKSIIAPISISIATLVIQTTLAADPIPHWDYTNHGTDWNFNNCNSTTKLQAPFDLY